jgi:hypothetical protein
MEKSSQAMALMWKAGQNALTELQKVNPSVCFQLAKMRGNDGRGAITNPDQLPKTLAGMEDYFLSGRPKLDGSTIYNQVKNAFNGDEHTFWQDVQQPLKQVNVQIYCDALPYKPYVMEKVMIKNSHPCWNTEEWNSFLIQQMEIAQANEGGHQCEVVSAFIDKPIMDGNKHGMNKKLNRINRMIYMQIPKGDKVQIQCLLDIVLKEEAILLCYHIPMRMVSKQSKFHSGGTCLCESIRPSNNIAKCDTA